MGHSASGCCEIWLQLLQEVGWLAPQEWILRWLRCVIPLFGARILSRALIEELLLSHIYIYNIYYIYYIYIYCLVTMVKPLNLMFEREIVGSRRMTFEVVPTSPWADAKAALLDFFRSLLFGTARRDGSAGAGTAQKMGKFWHPRNKHQRSRWVHRLPWKSVALFRSWPLAKSGEVAINKRLPQWSSYCSSD